jgi:hypothetical protein
MKKLLVGLIALGSFSTFAGVVVECSNGKYKIPYYDYSSEFDKHFEIEMDLTNRNSDLVKYQIVPNLEAHFQAHLTDNKTHISIAVGKTDIGWQPIALSSGFESTVLTINVNSLNFISTQPPKPRFSESKKEYAKRVEQSFSEGGQIAKQFVKRNGNIAIFVCRIKKN